MRREDHVQAIIENLAKLQRSALKSGVWKDLGISHAQVSVLYLLSFHNHSSVKQTGDFLGISKSAVTQLADPLVEKGLISRNNDPQDRRVVRMGLTDKGLQCLKKLAKYKYDGVRTAVGYMSDNDVENLSALLQTAAGFIKEKGKDNQ
jgi:DNA-binding MarR family transcriptional regulator